MILVLDAASLISFSQFSIGRTADEDAILAQEGYDMLQKRLGARKMLNVLQIHNAIEPDSGGIHHFVQLLEIADDELNGALMVQIPRLRDRLAREVYGNDRLGTPRSQETASVADATAGVKNILPITQFTGKLVSLQMD
jgi:hypothetical protein